MIPKQPDKVRRLVPLADVASVSRLVSFYGKLGFDSVNSVSTPTDGEEPHWAYLRSGQADLMVEVATTPVVPEQQQILIYLYTDDVYRFHTALSQAGVPVGELAFPTHSPMGEFRVVDPDGVRAPRRPELLMAVDAAARLRDAIPHGFERPRRTGGAGRAGGSRGGGRGAPPGHRAAGDREE